MRMTPRTSTAPWDAGSSTPGTRPKTVVPTVTRPAAAAPTILP
jgi:hypothetical protein